MFLFKRFAFEKDLAQVKCSFVPMSRVILEFFIFPAFFLADRVYVLAERERAHKFLSRDGDRFSSSPEFTKLLPEIDEMMNPIRSAEISPAECRKMIQSLKTTHPTLKRPGVIHTSYIINETQDHWNKTSDMERKMRLLPLSFLASQNLTRSKMYFWSNVDPSHPMVKEIFDPIFQNDKSDSYRKSIVLKKFELEKEMKQVIEGYQPDASQPQKQHMKEKLVETYKSMTEITSTSDLMRMALLFNYGGVWMDTDVVLVQDLTPIMEEDWVSLLYRDFVNQATISVSKAGSPFITAYLKKILAAPMQFGWSAYGPSMLHRMTEEIQTSGQEALFHILPNCFFEGACSPASVVEHQAATNWGEFFALAVDEKSRLVHMAYLDPKAAEHSIFGFHWHNRWEIPIINGSVADVTEKLYCRQLKLNFCQ